MKTKHTQFRNQAQRFTMVHSSSPDGATDHVQSTDGKRPGSRRHPQNHLTYRRFIMSNRNRITIVSLDEPDGWKSAASDDGAWPKDCTFLH